MAIAIGIWSQEFKPDDPSEVTPLADLRITNVALGDTLADPSGRTTVKLIYRGPRMSPESDEDEDEEDAEDVQPTVTVLCSLTPGKIESVLLDLVLNESEDYVFEVTGKNTVHFTGNYIDQNPIQNGPDDFSDMDSEDGYDLNDVSSDVEINPDDIEMNGDSDASRFEEVEEPAPKKGKRALEEEPSASEKKKANKKLKAANGDAVPTGDSPAKSDSEKPAKKEKKEKKDKETKEAAKPVSASGTEKELPGGLKIKDAKIGSGAAAKKGKRVEMRYIGKLTSGKIFDQNTKGKPFSFRLGVGEVIKGWDQGVAGMQVGGERILTVPADLAYGKKGQSGIPANSTLIFEVKLLSVK